MTYGRIDGSARGQNMDCANKNAVALQRKLSDSSLMRFGSQAASLPPRPNLRRYLLIFAIIGLSLYLVLPQFTQLQRALLVVLHLRPFFVGVALTTQVLSYLGSGYLLKTTVAQADRAAISVLDGTGITIGANSIGTLGGGVLGTVGMTFVWLRDCGFEVAAAGLGGWLPIFLNDIVLTAVSFAGLLVLFWMNKFPSVLATGLAGMFLTLSAAWVILLWGLTNRRRVISLVGRIVGYTAKLRGKCIDRSVIENRVRLILECWDMFFEGSWRGPALGAALNTGFDMLTLASLFAAASCPVALPVLVAGYGMPQLLGKVTVVLGGVGVVEATMINLYHSLNIPSHIAVVVVLAYRLLSFWLPTFLGIALMPYLNRRYDRATHEP